MPSYRTAYLLDPYRYEWVTKSGFADWGYNAFNILMSRQHAVTYYANAAVSHEGGIYMTPSLDNKIPKRLQPTRTKMEPAFSSRWKP